MEEQRIRNTVKWLIDGRVQGVGFRYYTRKKARELGINGTVRNLPDGRVEVVAQSDPGSLTSFYATLLKGPRWSAVTHIDEVKIESRDLVFQDFNVTFYSSRWEDDND